MQRDIRRKKSLSFSVEIPSIVQNAVGGGKPTKHEKKGIREKQDRVRSLLKIPSNRIERGEKKKSPGKDCNHPRKIKRMITSHLRSTTCNGVGSLSQGLENRGGKRV